MPYLGEKMAVLPVPWNWISIIALLLAIAFVATFLVEISLIGIDYLSTDQFRQEYIFKSLAVFLIALIIGLGIYIFESYRDHVQAANLLIRTHELEKERALKQASEARLASLESKLHPHFLFNTLNSISALISENPGLADQMVQRLASLLRNSLDACERNSVAVSEEISLVTDYLEIEKTRFRERLTYVIDVEPEVLTLKIPPMILLPLLENSVKFAIAPNPAGGTIKISARRFGRQLVFEVRDNGPGFASDMLPVGHGLDNLQSRLTALYRDAAHLSVRSEVEETVVAATLPLTGKQSK